jgi:hypothetical protein
MYFERTSGFEVKSQSISVVIPRHALPNGLLFHSLTTASNPGFGEILFNCRDISRGQEKRPIPCVNEVRRLALYFFPFTHKFVTELCRY